MKEGTEKDKMIRVDQAILDELEKYKEDLGMDKSSHAKVLREILNIGDVKVDDEKEKLLQKNKALQKSIAEHKASIAELDKQEAALRAQLGDSKARRRKLFADADDEIDALKRERMNIFNKAHGLPLDEGPVIMSKANKSAVVADSQSFSARNRSSRLRGKRISNDGLDPEIDALKQKRRNAYEDARKEGN